MRGGWGAGCNLQAEEKSGVGASRCWVCWTEPGVGLDKVITTALSPEYFVQLWVRHVRLVLGFCPQGCSSPTLQTTSVAGLSHRVIWQLLQLLLRVQPWLLAQPGPVGLQASSFSPLNLLPVGAWSFPATSFLSSFPLFCGCLSYASHVLTCCCLQGTTLCFSQLLPSCRSPCALQAGCSQPWHFQIPA